MKWCTSFVTLEPNSQPAPRGLIAQVSTSSGSDHTRSQKAPLWGISWLRSMVRIWSKVLMSGERPPWTHRTCSSINLIRHEKHQNQSSFRQTQDDSLLYFQVRFQCTPGMSWSKTTAWRACTNAQTYIHVYLYTYTFSLLNVLNGYLWWIGLLSQHYKKPTH